MTKVMLRAWIDAVLLPLAKRWVSDGLPLDQLGGTLIGYGVSILRTAGLSEDRIMDEVIGPALEGSRPEN